MKIKLYQWLRYSDHYVLMVELDNHKTWFDCGFNEDTGTITDITITKDTPEQFFIKYLKHIEEKDHEALVKQLDELIPILDLNKERYNLNDLYLAYNAYYGLQL